MRYVKGAISIIILLAMLAFAFQNLEVINVAFLTWSISVSKVIIIIGAYVFGMITGAWLFDFIKYLLKSTSTENESTAKAS